MTDSAVGRSCPYCRFPLKQGAPMLSCPSCHAVHHADCWNDNGGCAVMGCAAAPAAGQRPAPPSSSSATVEQTVPVAPAPPGVSPPPPSEPGRKRSPLIPLLIVLVLGLVGALGYVLSQSGSDGDPKRASAREEPAATGATAPVEDTPSPAATPDPDERTMATLDDIVSLSEIGKAETRDDPGSALRNRLSVRRRLRRLSAESPRLQAAIDTFEEAIDNAVSANRERAANGGVQTPFDIASHQLKVRFVRQVRPFARKYGYGPYDAEDI